MKQHELIIQIAPDGTVKLEVSGVTGSSCMDLTKELENELGNVINVEKKPEFFSSTVEENDTVAKNINTERK